MATRTINDIIQDNTNDTDTVNQFAVAQIPFHTHNDLDSPQVSFQNLSNRNEFLHVVIPGTSAATSANYGIFFIAPYPCLVIGSTEVHSTAGGSGAKVQVEKLTGTVASGSGIPLLMSGFDLTATANAVQTAKLANLPNQNFNLKVGDRLGLATSGTLTGADQVVVVVQLMY